MTAGARFVEIVGPLSAIGVPEVAAPPLEAGVTLVAGAPNQAGFSNVAGPPNHAGFACVTGPPNQAGFRGLSDSLCKWSWMVIRLVDVLGDPVAVVDR